MRIGCCRSDVGGCPPGRVYPGFVEGKEAMVFQGTKWSWKRIAANLLLVPVLAGGTAGAVHGQTKPGRARHRQRDRRFPKPAETRMMSAAGISSREEPSHG